MCYALYASRWVLVVCQSAADDHCFDWLVQMTGKLSMTLRKLSQTAPCYGQLWSFEIDSNVLFIPDQQEADIKEFQPMVTVECKHIASRDFVADFI